MTENCTQRILGLLHDEAFAALRRDAARHALPWEQLRKLPMPEGYTPEETWEILTAMRRQTAVVLPWRSYHSRSDVIWYSFTQTMASQFAEIDSRCRAGSALDRAISERASRYFLVRPLVEEMITSAWRDGLVTHYEDVRDMLRRERPPHDDAERLLFNSHELMYDLERYEKRRITPGLIEEFHERITDGVGELAITPRERSLTIVESPYADPYEALKMISTLGDPQRIDPFIHPIITVSSMAQIFWDFRPLPAWNAIVELQIRRLLFLQMGFPVLMFVPLSTLWRRWEEGTVRPPEVLARFAELDPDCGEGMDATTQYAVYLQLVLGELEGLEQLVNETKVRDEQVSAMLDHDPEINHRQRALLDQSLRNPDIRYRIEPHRQLYGIAYATARKDFLGLVSHGFMLLELDGKAFVFRPHPDLKSIIERSRVSTDLDPTHHR